MNMEEFKFEMGDEVKEKITGFSGIITAKAKYYTGCRHYGVQPKKLGAKGEMQAWEWLDETRLVLVKKAVIARPKTETSGPGYNPPMR